MNAAKGHKRKADAVEEASDPLAWAREAQSDNRLRLQLENGALVNLNEEQLQVIASALQGAKYDASYLKMKKKEGSLGFVTQSGHMLPVTTAEPEPEDPPPASSHVTGGGWSIEYAKSGESKCLLTGGTIEQGKLRIGKEVDHPKHTTAWHTVDALFASFCKGAADKARITDVAELNGFDALKKADQEMLRELVADATAVREKLDEAQATATRLEHTKDGGVFWQIATSGSSTRTQYGALGTEGAFMDKEHADEAAAAKYAEKMVQQKLKGGYQHGSVRSYASSSSLVGKWTSQKKDG